MLEDNDDATHGNGPDGALHATISGQDERRRLCLLAVPRLAAPPLAVTGASAPPAVGTPVYAVSNALGLGIGISEGVVSGLRSQSGAPLIQFSAPVSAGSEGGALVDAQGRLLGIVDDQQHGGQNVNFAVPAPALATLAPHPAADDQQQRREEARDLARREDWQALADLSARWSEAQPDDPEGWQWLTTAAQKLGDTTNEERAWRALRRLDPDSTAYGAGLARVLIGGGQGAAALDLARDLLDRRGQDADLWSIDGQAEQATGNLAAADEAYRKALSLDPWQVQAQLGLVGIAEARGDRAAATAGWQRLYQLLPETPGIPLALAQAYLSEGRPARAHALLERLTAPLADTGDAWFLKGLTLVALGRPVAAVAALQRSLERSPSAPAQVHGLLGQTLFELGRYPESIESYRAAVALDPDNDRWRSGLLLPLKNNGYQDEALAIGRTLVEHQPQDAWAWRQLGFAEAFFGHPGQSIPALERSLALDARQGMVWRVLMEQYHATGRMADLRRAWEQLREVDAGSADQAWRALLLPYEEEAP